MQQTNKNVPEQIDLLELAKVVFNRLPFIALTAFVCMCVAVVYVQVVTPIYQTSTKILVTPLKGSTSMEGMFDTNVGSSAKISTEVDLIKSEATLSHALELMNLSKYNTSKEDYTQLKVKNISGLISVSSSNDTRNIKITVNHPNPVFAADLANAVAQSYQELLSNITKQSSRAQIDTITNQIPVSEAQLSQSLSELSDFKSANGTEQMANKITVLTAKIAEIQLQRSPLELQKSETLAKLGSEPKQVSYPTIEEKLDSYSKSVKEYLLYKGVGDDDVNSSRLYSLESQINTINQDIISELTFQTGDPAYAKNLSDYLCVIARMNVLNEIEEMYSRELASYQVIQGRLQELQSNVNVNQSLVLSLKSMLEEAKVVESSEQTNVTIIDPAKVPDRPVKPQKLKVVAIAILFGIVAATAYVVLETLLDTSVKTENDVNKILQGTISSLGWIPYVHQDEEERKTSKVILYPLTGHESYVAERYRVLAANIEYVGKDDVKVMVVNSADLGEGKTTITCNLASTLATNGKKVLVIDGDLRRPEMERAFDITRCKSGLTDVLIDGVPYEEAIVRPVKNLDNLHLLAAGHSSKNPNIVFGSKGFAELIAKLRDIYDYIFIDCPPVSFGSDFGIIAKTIDAYMFAIRAGYTTRDQVANLIETKSFIPSKLLGYIFYGTLEDSTGYGYGYGYYGKYGYGKYGYGKYGYGKYGYGKYGYGKYGYGKYGYADSYSTAYAKGKHKRFTLRRKVNYRKIRAQEFDKRQKVAHTYGTYKAPLAFASGFANAFGNLDEVAIMRSTITKVTPEPKNETSK